MHCFGQDIVTVWVSTRLPRYQLDESTENLFMSGVLIKEAFLVAVCVLIRKAIFSLRYIFSDQENLKSDFFNAVFT
jgi:hypothetical protein